MCRACLLLTMVTAAFGLCVPVASADEAQLLEKLPQLHAACREVGAGRRPVLYSVSVPAGAWRFARYEASARLLPVDTRRNLRALRGAVELFPARLETVGFAVDAAQASRLRALSPRATLRVGFFLGFDNPHRSACLLRPAVGVTTVRAEVAFLEIEDEDGTTLLREELDLLTAWRDDVAQDGVPGSGPRGRVTEVSPLRGAATEALREGFEARALTAALEVCHREGIARGARPDGQVILRLLTEGRGFTATVELASTGDPESARCVAEAVAREARVPAGMGELRVAVRLAAD